MMGPYRLLHVLKKQQTSVFINPYTDSAVATLQSVIAWLESTVRRYGLKPIRVGEYGAQWGAYHAFVANLNGTGTLYHESRSSGRRCYLFRKHPLYCYCCVPIGRHRKK